MGRPFVRFAAAFAAPAAPPTQPPALRRPHSTPPQPSSAEEPARPARLQPSRQTRPDTCYGAPHPLTIAHQPCQHRREPAPRATGTHFCRFETRLIAGVEDPPGLGGDRHLGKGQPGPFVRLPLGARCGSRPLPASPGRRTFDPGDVCVTSRPLDLSGLRRAVLHA